LSILFLLYRKIFHSSTPAYKAGKKERRYALKNLDFLPVPLAREVALCYNSRIRGHPAPRRHTYEHSRNAARTALKPRQLKYRTPRLYIGKKYQRRVRYSDYQDPKIDR